MRKIVPAILAVLLVLTSLFGCASPAPADFCIDSKNYFNIGVPTNSGVFLQTSWYRISAHDYGTDQSLSATKFIVGKDVEVLGINTDQLRGADIYVRQSNLADRIDKDYYKTMYQEACYEQGVKPELNSAGEVRSQDVNRVRRALQQYVSTAKVLSCTLSFGGRITKDIQIDSIRIASIDYKVDFDSFRITPLALPENRINEVYCAFSSGGFTGMLVGPPMPRSGNLCLEGTLETAIREIRVEAIDNSCVVVNQNNYADYAAYSTGFGDYTINGQKTGPFLKNEEIRLAYDYVYPTNTPEDFKKYDSTVVCLKFIFTLEDGTELNGYHYQAATRLPEYGLVHLLSNES